MPSKKKKKKPKKKDESKANRFADSDFEFMTVYDENGKQILPK